MLQSLAEKDPNSFRTQTLSVDLSETALHYRPNDESISFAQMQALRRPLSVPCDTNAALQLANLGVSVRLSLNWQGQDYWVLVRQQRADRGDSVLKLISGYVPSNELACPEKTVLQEIAEECLLETNEGWLGGVYQNQRLLNAYPKALHYHPQQHFVVKPTPQANRPIYCSEAQLNAQPDAYVHLPSASLQLIYNMRLALPATLSKLSLWHTDERLLAGKLLVPLDRSRADIFLLPLEDSAPRKQLFQLFEGQLIEVLKDDFWLSEAFAPRQGWLVHDEHIHWRDWLPSY